MPTIRVEPQTSPLAVELRPYALGAVFLRRWRWTIAFPIIIAVLTAAIVMILPPRWTSVTSFIIQSSSDMRMPSGIASLAGQFGLGLTAPSGQSPAFYADLATSRTVLEQILAEKTGPGSLTGPTLLEWLDAGGATPDERVYRATTYLRHRVSADVDRETGVVTVQVSLRDPVVASRVGTSILAALDRFNTGTRQSTARAKRLFAQQRVAEAEAEVRRVDDQLQAFYEANRTFQNSPSLQAAERRIQARLSLQNEVLASLRREYENARIAEVNDTPVLTVIDAPSVPYRRSFPKRKLAVLAGLFGSLALGLAIAFLREGIQLASMGDDEGHRRFVEARTHAADQLRRLLGRR